MWLVKILAYREDQVIEMDILVSSFSYNFLSSKPSNTFLRKSFTTFCSRKDNDDPNDNTGDKSSTDWDRAWTIFKKRGKKSFFSKFSPNKYVSWNPKRSEYPLSEEVDPIKRTERSNLQLWTSPRFTLFGAIIIVSFLLLYTILAPIK